MMSGEVLGFACLFVQEEVSSTCGAHEVNKIIIAKNAVNNFKIVADVVNDFNVLSFYKDKNMFLPQ
jgi:hypothetical protein